MTRSRTNQVSMMKHSHFFYFKIILHKLSIHNNSSCMRTSEVEQFLVYSQYTRVDKNWSLRFLRWVILVSLLVEIVSNVVRNIFITYAHIFLFILHKSFSPKKLNSSSTVLKSRILELIPLWRMKLILVAFQCPRSQ